jgi:dienelactone hydrolase
VSIHRSDTGRGTLASRLHAARAAISCAVALGLLLTQSKELLADPAMTTSAVYGAFGPEGQRMREQLWLLPSGDTAVALRATVFRPAGGLTERRPLVVINHGTSELNRMSVSMPVYYWLSRWFVDRGYAVVLPQRRGHGATGGTLVESVGDCANPDHYRSGLVAAEDVGAAVDYMVRQPFVDPTRVLIVGVSTGGWASLALASQRPELVAAVVNFSGGRGGHAWGRNNSVCGADELVKAAHDYARTARAPTLWLYAQNDSYFGPAIAARMAEAWKDGGGNAEYDPLPTYGADGHDIVDDRAGWDVWGSALSHFLDTHLGVPKEPQVAQGP